MAIRRNNSRKTDTTYYSPSHIKSIVKSLGIEIAAETSHDFLCYCPFHNNRQTPSFSVGREIGAFLCFNPVCGESGTLIDLVKKILFKNEFQAMRYISVKEEEVADDFEDLLDSILEDKPEFVEFDQNLLDSLHENIKKNQKAVDYLQSRNINEGSIDFFKIGYSENMDMVTVPVHSPTGVPVGLFARSIEGKKFKNSTNLPRSKTMFNLHRAKRIGDIVIVVESVFDAIRLHQAGYPNVVATLGGHLSNENFGWLNRYFNRITIMTDADRAGRELGHSIASKLSSKDVLWASYSYKKVFPRDAKDVGDMTDSEIRTCLENAVSDIEYKSW